MHVNGMGAKISSTLAQSAAFFKDINFSISDNEL